MFESKVVIQCGLVNRVMCENVVGMTGPGKEWAKRGMCETIMGIRMGLVKNG